MLGSLSSADRISLVSLGIQNSWSLLFPGKVRLV